MKALFRFLVAGVEAVSWRTWLSAGRPGAEGQCNFEATKKPRSPGRERGKVGEVQQPVGRHQVQGQMARSGKPKRTGHYFASLKALILSNSLVSP